MHFTHVESGISKRDEDDAKLVFTNVMAELSLRKDNHAPGSQMGGNHDQFISMLCMNHVLVNGYAAPGIMSSGRAPHFHDMRWPIDFTIGTDISIIRYAVTGLLVENGISVDKKPFLNRKCLDVPVGMFVDNNIDKYRFLADHPFDVQKANEIIDGSEYVPYHISNLDVFGFAIIVAMLVMDRCMASGPSGNIDLSKEAWADNAGRFFNRIDLNSSQYAITRWIGLEGLISYSLDNNVEFSKILDAVNKTFTNAKQVFERRRRLLALR